MVNTDTHNSSKAIFCIAAAAKSAAVVACGGADRAWRLWDRRQSRKEDMVKTFFLSFLQLPWHHMLASFMGNKQAVAGRVDRHV